MRSVEPEIRLVARPQLDYDMIAEYLAEVGGSSWLERLDRDQLDNDAQNLAEFAGKMCYRSWEPGLNPNVRRVRDDQLVYLQNILAQSHGSVLEHISFTFVLHNVSRVFTHELVRHRPGTAVSQESLRFVRLADIPFWFPEWAREDEELMKRAGALLTEMEAFQRWMAGHFGLDDDGTKMHEKKHKTSFMRRFAPDGVATGLVWTANVRTLRHTIESRTDPGAEEEIRLVFGKIGELMRAEAPGPVRGLRSARGRRLGSRLAKGLTQARTVLAEPGAVVVDAFLGSAAVLSSVTVRAIIGRDRDVDVAVPPVGQAHHVAGSCRRWRPAQPPLRRPG